MPSTPIPALATRPAFLQRFQRRHGHHGRRHGVFSGQDADTTVSRHRRTDVQDDPSKSPATS
eukprot:scaffold325457_cov28-Attheya_sp.AAC.1